MNPKLILTYTLAFFAFVFWLGGNEILLPLSIACGAFFFVFSALPHILVGMFRDDL